MPFRCFEAAFVIPGAASLKDKRMVVRSVKDRIRSRFNVSVAESADNDKWQRCSMCFAVAASDGASAERIKQDIIGFLGSEPRIEVTEIREGT